MGAVGVLCTRRHGGGEFRGGFAQRRRERRGGWTGCASSPFLYATVIEARCRAHIFVSAFSAPLREHASSHRHPGLEPESRFFFCRSKAAGPRLKAGVTEKDGTGAVCIDTGVTG